MASFVPENWDFIDGCDDYDTGALLMSQLLDESHVEDCDDERLTSVIRSLEAEINEPNVLIEHIDSFMELEWDDNLAEICKNKRDEKDEDVINGQDCSTTSSDDDLVNYNWMEMEDMNEYYYHYPRFINLDNVSNNFLEEQSYGSLWQDTDVLDNIVI